jgi:beta-xylosidase
VLEAGRHYYDRRTIQAPLVIEHEKRYYMIYNGVSENQTCYICLATSDDLEQWTEYPGNPIYHPDTSWSDWNPEEGSHRGDAPDIIRVGDEYIMYFTSETQTRSCIGCALSEDLVHWRDGGPVLVVPFGLCSCGDLESPTVAVHNGIYYLFYGQMGIEWLAVSEDPFHFDSFMPWAEVLGADVRELGGEWYITSLPYSGWPVPYINTYHPDHKGLYLARLEWVNDFPFIRHLGNSGIRS